MGFLDYCIGDFNIWSGVICGFVLLLVIAYKTTRRKPGLPPGPPAVPILGSLPFMDKDIRKELVNLRKKYGDLVTIQLGMYDMVVLNSYDVIKDALVNHSHAFSGRPQDNPLLNELTNHCGFLAREGKTWQEQRKFTHGVLRDFGMGHTLLENKIKEELEYFVQCLEKHVESPYDITLSLYVTVSNIICSIVFGKRYEYDDPYFKTQMENLSAVFKIIGGNNPCLGIPWLRHLPGDLFGIKELKQRWKSMFQFFQAHVDKHNTMKSPGQVPANLIDAYLQQIEKEKENSDTSFHNKQLLHTIENMFSAGTETTATTMRWAILFMLHHPDVQDKVIQEIKEVLGERSPTMQDKVNMPYTEATLMEIQRMGDIAPLAVFHSATEDVAFRGYLIPKGTWIIPNLGIAHNDPQIWKDSHMFDPTRFLGSNGKVEKKEQLIPFSMGKRLCIGESIARMELFLFFTTLLQRFTFRLPPGHPLPDLKGVLGIANSPKPYTVWLVSQA